LTKILSTRHVLAVPDAETTATFFCDKLGFARIPVGDPGWRFVERDGHVVMLGSCPDAIHPAKLGDHSYFAYVTVDSVDALHEELVKRGAAPKSPPGDKPWGMREFVVRTPDGHGMTFGQRLS
jgi:uncharacterized glyoxalase superfamily protein PhnB